MPVRHLTLVALVLVAACAVYAQRLSRPLIHHHDWTVAEFSLSAKNTLRYGLLATRFGQVTNVEVVPPEEFDYYVHTPPGLVFLIAGMFRLVGYHVYGARLVAVYMTLLAGSALYALARRLYGNTTGLWSLIFFAFTPSAAYFGPMLEYDSMIEMIALLMVGFYLWGLRGKRKGWLAPMLALAVMGVWSGWLVYLFLPLLWLHAHLLGDKSVRRGMWLVGIVAMLAAGLLIASLVWQRPDFATVMGEIIATRTGNSSPEGTIFIATGKTTFTWLEWFEMQGERVLWMFTPTVVTLALYGAFRVWRSTSRDENMLVAVLLLTVAVYVTVVRQASLFHEYLLFTLGAPLAVWAAWGWVALWRRWRRARVLRGALVLLVLLYIVGSARWTVGLYNYLKRPENATIGQALGALTQSEDRIATNLSYPGPVPAFYADRRIDYEAPADDLLSRRDETAYTDWFLYCPTKDQDLDPALLADYPHEPVANCELIQLH
jgi:4-amino-4-deoxy-L-arabinose transferase-like glycosyltransferase